MPTQNRCCRRGGHRRPARPRARRACRRTVALAPQGPDRGRRRRDRRPHDPRSEPPRQFRRRDHGRRAAARAGQARAEPIPLTVVYEDDDIIVIDKPRNLVVHPAAGHWTGTLVNALIAHCGDSLSGIGGERRPGIVHRLDKDTTGLMVVAKNDRAHRALAAQFADHGRTASRSSAAISPSSGARRTGRTAPSTGRSTAHPHARDRMAVREGGREAVTHWQVLERYRASRARSRRRTGKAGKPAEPVASLLPAGWRPAAPTRSGSIWPRSAIRCWATTSMGPDFAPKPACCRQKPAALADLGRQALHAHISVGQTPHRAAKSSSSGRNCRPTSPVCMMHWSASRAEASASVVTSVKDLPISRIFNDG